MGGAAAGAARGRAGKLIRAGGQCARLHLLWERHHIPPWEALGVTWAPVARRAWYQAALSVALAIEQEQARGWQDVLRAREAAQRRENLPAPRMILGRGRR